MAHDQSDIVKDVIEAGGSRVDRRSARDDQGFSLANEQRNRERKTQGKPD